MAETNDDCAMTISRGDEQIFQRLAEARQQYEQYLSITRSTALFVLVESPVAPPSPDLPLSLTIWRDKVEPAPRTTDNKCHLGANCSPFTRRGRGRS